MDWPYLFGFVLILNSIPVLIAAAVIRFRSSKESFDDAVDDALNVAAADPEPCDCPWCVDLTEDVVNYGFDEIVEDGLSPFEYRRLKRLGALFGVQPPVIPGRDDQ